jgi:enoyl-CoA hydratase/carnithine racemase
VARAKDLLFNARLMDAVEAERIGLAKVVAAERLDTEARTLAEELSARAPSTIRATKALLDHLRAYRQIPPAPDIIAACYGSADFQEGVRAFLEGRPPRWSSEQ